MAIWIKQGVSLHGLEPQMFEAAAKIGEIYTLRNHDCWITGGVELAPGRVPTSLHPKGKALDFGTTSRGVRDPVRMSHDIKAALGDDFDVILERDHIHVEFQPE